jgi:group II intron reverse transcriptase/maturase
VNKISGGGKSRGAVLTALTCETISKRKHLLHTEVDFSVHRDGRKKGKQMATKLARIAELSSQNPKMVFASIGHLIDVNFLKECHMKMDGDKAVGIDGITKEEYGIHLNENLVDLVDRLKRKAYKPKPAKRVEIPKDNGKTRPLSIYCYEDKLVQEALRRILEAVFEPMFYDEMMGFRPNRSCHQALRKLNAMIENKPTNYILDADIKGFFDHLDHEWIVKFVESRIKDPNIIRLVRRMLKAGIMKDYRFEDTEEGSGQGSVCSPILANIYMHYVLLWWFKETIQPKLKGYSGIIVYADDFVVCFQHRVDAEVFYERLKRRMGNFGLSLEEEKSRLIEFGRFASENCAKRGTKPETFSFLGFTHYCSQSRNGRFRVKRKTNKKKFSKKLKEIHRKIGEMRTMRTKDIVKKLNEILVGYFHYYGISDNSRSIKAFRYEVMKSLFYWLNRRSQKKSYNWVDFLKMLDYTHPLAEAKIYVSIYA